MDQVNHKPSRRRQSAINQQKLSSPVGHLEGLQRRKIRRHQHQKSYHTTAILQMDLLPIGQSLRSTFVMSPSI